MKLDIKHAFDCDPDAFWEMFWDPAFDERVLEGAAVQRETLETRTEADGKRVQRFRFIPERTLPGPVAKLAGTDRLTYEQENRFDPESRVLTWTVRPAVLPDKVTAEGQMWVEAAPNGCVRRVEGRIDVRVPFVGGRIEQAIVQEVQSSYERAADVTRDWIAERQGRS